MSQEGATGSEVTGYHETLGWTNQSGVQHKASLMIGNQQLSGRMTSQISDRSQHRC